MVIGVAPPGGSIRDSWMPALLEALEAGLDLVSGMHARLHETPALRDAAKRLDRQLIDIRTPARDIPLGTGRKRTGKRLLTVGTDCALGKKYTALSLARAFTARGLAAEFRATGQTGILIAGTGVPLDAVVADFVAGAAEALSPDAAAGHWDVIEGQGSLSHPAYAGVSMGLLHGSQPDVFVVCHQPGRTHVLGSPGFLLPTIEETIQLVQLVGRRTNANIRCGGVSLNTSALSPDEAEREIAAVQKRLRLPAADPIRGGAAFEALVASCLA